MTTHTAEQALRWVAEMAEEYQRAQELPDGSEERYAAFALYVNAESQLRRMDPTRLRAQADALEQLTQSEENGLAFLARAEGLVAAALASGGAE